MTKHSQIKKCIEHFETSVLFNPEFDHLDIQSVFIDHKDSERRAVIITSDKTDLNKVRDIVAPFFEGVLYKVIHQHGEARFTKISLNTGHQVRNFKNAGWGTLGGVIKKNNVDYGISNSHVLCDLNDYQLGDNIMYEPNKVAGTLFNFYRIKPGDNRNLIDAAIFKIDTSSLDPIWVTPTPTKLKAYGARINMRVQKNGSATGVTLGIVQSVAGSGRVSLNGVRYNFSGIIGIKGINRDFNQPGDSGSLVLTEPGGHIVAIVFAKQNDFCWALPFSYVLRLFDKA